MGFPEEDDKVGVLGELVSESCNLFAWITMWMSGRLIDLEFIIEIVFWGGEDVGRKTYFFPHAVLYLH
jgi:hypothetical protein